MNGKLMRAIAINMYLIEKSKLGDKRYIPRYPRYANNKNLIKKPTKLLTVNQNKFIFRVPAATDVRCFKKGMNVAMKTAISPCFLIHISGSWNSLTFTLKIFKNLIKMGLPANRPVK